MTHHLGDDGWQEEVKMRVQVGGGGEGLNRKKTSALSWRQTAEVTHHLGDNGRPEGGEVLGRHAQDEDAKTKEHLHHQAGYLRQTQALCQSLCKRSTLNTNQQPAHQAGYL